MPSLLRLVLLLCLCFGLAQQGLAAGLRGLPSLGQAAAAEAVVMKAQPCHKAEPTDPATAAEPSAHGSCSVCAACCMALALPAPLPELQMPQARESWWLDPAQAPPGVAGSTLFRPPRTQQA